MTRHELVKAILNAQLTKPRGMLTGTSDWAAWVANEVIKHDQALKESSEENNTPILGVTAGNL